VLRRKKAKLEKTIRHILAEMDIADIQLNEVCRVCLQNGEMHSIFDRDDTDMVYTDKIMQTTSLVIEKNDNLPMQICEECIQDLNVAYKFRMNCESSDAILQMYAEKIDQQAAMSSTTSKYKTEIVRVKEEIHEESVLSEDMSYFDEEALHEYETEPLEASEDMEAGAKKIIKQQMLVKSEVKGPGSTTPRERRRHICDLCGVQLKNKTELSAHMRRHLGERPFPCDHCDKRFTVMSGLRVHLRTHTGEKPYACKHCGRRFSDFGSRNRHERTHTGKTVLMISIIF
jgi:Zinc-finger associated domain (zf-AD)/Zinc finger, C2H2 type